MTPVGLAMQAVARTHDGAAEVARLLLACDDIDLNTFSSPWTADQPNGTPRPPLAIAASAVSDGVLDAADLVRLLVSCGANPLEDAALQAIVDRELAAATAAAARLADVAAEPLARLNPIVGVMRTVRLSLLYAAAATGVEDLDAFTFLAAESGQALVAEGSGGVDARGLDADECGALYLYTMESQLYTSLNALLRARNREALKPYFPYLHLLLSAREKLPRYAGVCWRGVRGDLRASYVQGREIYWWAVSSCTRQLDVLSSPQFLGTSGERTQFMIEVTHGVDISHYSCFQQHESEHEVLLFPGTKLLVVASVDLGNGLFQVHLREVAMPVALMS